ncbi:MAG: DUF424 family protein [Candidatus Marsarchaeota archaeon]|nr:DUF424 family protein [Candidatus Marsarchaeota archaeon]
MIYVKMHESDDGDILAMCDESLIDKTLSEGEMLIDVKGYSDFYTGELVDATNYELPRLDEVISFNIIGEESVGLCIRNSIIDIDNVKTIEGVPFAHAYKVDKPK